MKDLADENDVKEHNAKRNKEIANLSIFFFELKKSMNKMVRS